MARRYVMTARRKAALKKAQLASARKRKRGGRMSARQHRRSGQKEKYGSRRKGLTKTQYKARKNRTRQRVAKGIGYAATAGYLGAVTYVMAPNTTTAAARKLQGTIKPYNTPRKVVRRAKTARTNYQFNKIIKANY